MLYYYKSAITILLADELNIDMISVYCAYELHHLKIYFSSQYCLSRISQQVQTSHEVVNVIQRERLLHR